MSVLKKPPRPDYLYVGDKMIINSSEYILNSFDYIASGKFPLAYRCPFITKVIFNNPATIVFWSSGEKTVVKSGDGEKYDPEKGLAMAISKYHLGNRGNYYETFKKWLPEEEPIIFDFENFDKYMNPPIKEE